MSPQKENDSCYLRFGGKAACAGREHERVEGTIEWI